MAVNIFIFHKSDTILPIEVFGHLFRFQGLKRKIQNGGSKYGGPYFSVYKSGNILLTGIFRDDKSDTEVIIAKLKITDPIWRPKF